MAPDDDDAPPAHEPVARMFEQLRRLSFPKGLPPEVELIVRNAFYSGAMSAHSLLVAARRGALPGLGQEMEQTMKRELDRYVRTGGAPVSPRPH